MTAVGGGGGEVLGVLVVLVMLVSRVRIATCCNALKCSERCLCMYHCVNIDVCVISAE